MNILHNINLKDYTTFGVDVHVDSFTTFSSIDSLVSVLKTNNQKFLVLGGGSNMLFIKDFNGLILKNEIRGVEKVEEDDNSVLLKVGGGEVWNDFVQYSISQNYQGIENLSLIPGSVGASPIQNIGAYGVEVKDVIEKVEVVDSVDFGIKTFDNLSCEFGYRNSIFKSKFPGRFVITNVFFRLKKSKNINTSYGAIKTELHQKGIENPTIKDVSDAVISIRKSKLPDPKLLGNAGSFFKNPIVKKVLVDEIAKRYPSVPFYEISNSLVKIPAGWLIETAGWKGFKENDYGVHEKQALVLVNYGKATGIEIYNLSQRIIEDIEAKFHIRLEREVNIL